MNGNGKLTETENVIFYLSYRILMEFLKTEHGDTVTDERNCNAGNQALECLRQ